MKRRMIRKETALYIFIAVVVILLVLLLGGRRWMNDNMHGTNSSMEMDSNHD